MQLRPKPHSRRTLALQGPGPSLPAGSLPGQLPSGMVTLLYARIDDKQLFLFLALTFHVHGVSSLIRLNVYETPFLISDSVEFRP